MDKLMVCRAFNINYFEIDNMPMRQWLIAKAMVEQEYKEKG